MVQLNAGCRPLFVLVDDQTLQVQQAAAGVIHVVVSRCCVDVGLEHNMLQQLVAGLTAAARRPTCGITAMQAMSTLGTARGATQVPPQLASHQ